MDFMDGDQDHANTWQEWKAGTNPTDQGSVLRLLQPEVGTGGTTVRWLSVEGRDYVVERAGAVHEAFQTVSPPVAGQSGKTSFADTSATNGTAFFYRVSLAE